MINFKEEIGKLIGQQVEGLTLEEIQSMIEVPQDAKMGDYAFPCFKLAKTLRKAPPLIAKGIAEGDYTAADIPAIKNRLSRLRQPVGIFMQGSP